MFNPDGDSDSGTPTPVCPDEAEEVADLATELGNLMEAEGFVHRQEPLPLQDAVDLPVPEGRPKRCRSRSALVEPAAKRGVLAKAKAKPEGKAKAKAQAKPKAQAQAPAAAASDVAA